MGRRILGVSKMTTREVIQGELGLEKLSSRRILLRLKFWSKIVRMKKERLVYRIYKIRRQDFIKGGKKDKNNWCFWTWKFLKNLNLEHIWESENFGEPKSFQRLVRSAIRIQEEREWREQMKCKPKLDLYRKIKSSLSIEEYILELSREKRRQLTMMRGGTNYLRIERGRWKGEKREERVCNVCLCEVVEDEKHFLLECPMYVRERERSDVCANS
jgi:hypothetical protein